MRKRLVITYGDVTLYDDEPEQFSWQETGDAIQVKAGAVQPNPLEKLAANLNGRQRQALPGASP